MSELKYYSLAPILAKKAKYNVIIGMRSNGKTYACLKHGLEEYWKHGSEIAYLRRYREDFRGKRGEQLFASLVENNAISEITNGEWTGVKYYSYRWYLTKEDESGDIVKSDKPFCYGFSISEMEHDKSVSYPSVRTVIFDEFITRQYYFNDEFVIFCNCLSTIIRLRTDVTIFMLGNTVNKYCPYFKEMGLKHVDNMEPGTIDTYKTVGGLRIAVEYCATQEKQRKSRPSDIYFSFDNPKLEMITGGVWELDIYPHLPCRYTPADIIFNYFIDFDSQLLQCEIVSMSTDNIFGEESTSQICFTYIHRKTTELKYPDQDIVFSTRYDPRPNWFRNIRRPVCDVDRRISSFFHDYKVFYQDNEVGEVVRNYLIFCQKDM